MRRKHISPNHNHGDQDARKKLKTHNNSILPLIALFVSASILIWIFISSSLKINSVPVPQVEHKQSNQHSTHKFYQEEVKPLLRKTAARNKQAKRDFIARVNSIFDRYETGIEPFCEDICSMGTRFAIMTRMMENTWSEQENVQNYVQSKFEKHLFSTNELKHDLEKAFRALQQDLEANRNRLLSGVRAAVDGSEVPVPDIPDFKGYEESVRQQILEISSKQGEKTVYSGILTLVASESGAILIERIAVRLLGTYGTSAAVSAAASVGTAATSATTGGTLGSLAGPVGTGVGIAAGLILSIPIDMKFSSHFQNELKEKMTTYMTKLRKALLHGTSKQQGLIRVIDDFTRSLNRAQANAMKEAIIWS